MATPNVHTGYVPTPPIALPRVVTNASVASNGAGARIGQFGPMGHQGRVRNAWWSPTGADNPGTAVQTDSYRRLSLYNGGTAGTVTATASRIASFNLTASQASLGRVAGTLTTFLTFDSGDVLYFSQETVGGNHNDSTVLVAGQFALDYEHI